MLEKHEAIFFPAQLVRFKVRYVFNDSLHPALAMQTVKVSYDLANKTFEATLELPLHDTEMLDDLIQLTSMNTPFKLNAPCIVTPCIVVDYTEGDNTVGSSMHCFLEEIKSCEIVNDYSGPANTVTKVELKCKIRTFMAVANTKVEENVPEVA